MIVPSVIIPALNAAAHLPATLAALGSGDEVIVVDGGSSDETVDVAKRAGVRLVVGPRGRGTQLARGADEAKGAWLLFLHADTVLEPTWREEVARFIADDANRERAAVFRFALDTAAPAARRLERLVALRVRWFGLPYGDQGLLISRAFYRAIGGFAALPIMEDVDLVRRIGRSRIVPLDTAAITSAERWERDGWWRRSARNIACLTLHFAGVPATTIARLYG